MLDRSYPRLIKSLAIVALILVTLGGSVAITPRYIFWGYSDVACCDGAADYDWLGIFIVVPFVGGVALTTAVLKLWLDNRATRRPRRF